MGSSCKVAPVGAAIHFANFAMLIIPVHPSGVGRVINQCANYPLICLERVKLAGLCRGVPLYTKNACTTKLLVLQLLYQLEEGSSWQRQLVTSG